MWARILIREHTKEIKSFLEKLGGYRRNRREGKEGLTLAGLLMFGDGLAIRDEFDNIFMDYRNESQVTADIRWNDRITYDGTWKNAGWIEPMLEEDTRLNQVTLTLKMISKSQEVQGNSNSEVIESAEKSADKTIRLEADLSDCHKQILSLMDTNVEYSAEEIAELIALKGSRTRQLLKELADKGKISFTAATKNRKYKKL